MAALLFLYKHVLDEEIPWLDNIVRAKKSARLPVVLTRDEVFAVLAQLNGVTRLVSLLLYGAGFRLLEGLQLRVKDVDVGARQLTIRSGKGNRVALLRGIVRPDMEAHLRVTREVHQRDLELGRGRVAIRNALSAKRGATPSDIPLPLISSRTDTTSEPSKNSSATAMSARR